MRPVTAWIAAARPRTLGLSLSPVVVGTALGVSDTGEFHAAPFVSALAAALAIQIGTNLHNDVADHLRGIDGADRLGPPRATAQGWLSPRAVGRGAWTAFGVAFLFGAYLVWWGGTPILLLGLASLAAAFAYSGGPRPLSALPLGELFVFLFFGLAAVAGSDYLQTGAFRGRALLAGVVMGLPAAAVLVVNNHRDRETDRRAGRRTLSVLLPLAADVGLYALLILSPFALLPLLLSGWPLLLPLALLPAASMLVIRMRRARGPALNGVLAATARLQTLLGLALAGAFLLARGW